MSRLRPEDVASYYKELNIRPARGFFGDQVAKAACAVGVCHLRRGTSWSNLETDDQDSLITALGLTVDYGYGFINGFDGELLGALDERADPESYALGYADGQETWKTVT